MRVMPPNERTKTDTYIQQAFLQLACVQDEIVENYQPRGAVHASFESGPYARLAIGGFFKARGLKICCASRLMPHPTPK